MLTLFIRHTITKTKIMEMLIPIHKPNKKMSVIFDSKGFASNLKYSLAFLLFFLNLFFET
jgi:hypothetical protein